MKKLLLLVCALTTTLLACNDQNTGPSPGVGYTELAGTWRLYERGFTQDSSYTVRIDTVNTTRDTSFYTIKRYPATPPQTLTFGENGSLTTEGNEVSYYRPVQYYRVGALPGDVTQQDTAQIRLFIYTNGANVGFTQRLTFRQDTLVLMPPCPNCYLKFLRAQ